MMTSLLTPLELRTQLQKFVIDNLCACASWDDLVLENDFYEMAQGVRLKVNESARREVLSRLLKLNHERYEEEQRRNAEGGMQKAKKEKKVKKSKSTDGQMGLL